ncbi:MAG: hypothetical protein Q9212_001351 [Teloschistes hypoglaucus]
MSIKSLYASTKATFHELTEPNDFKTSTWMAFGATLLFLSQSCFSSRIINLIPILYLVGCVIKMGIDTLHLHTRSYTNMRRGWWTATLPNADASSDNKRGSDEGGVVAFLLGARINHPLGKLTPGAKEIGDIFQEMWTEAETNRVKWGYLGRTATLVDYSDSERTPTFWLSYWKDLKGLQAFSENTIHRLGVKNYIANKYPYMGIMHETFYAPKGCWETIYANFPPWGFGQAQVVEEGADGTIKLENTLIPNRKHSTMFRRMGRENYDGA